MQEKKIKMMFLYYLRVAFRNLIVNKSLTIINISSFSFAISVCLAIGLFIANEYSYDRFNTNETSVYRFIDTKNNSSMIDYRVRDILLNNFPDIENACLVQRLSNQTEVIYAGKGYYLDDIMSVDNSYFDIFTLKFLGGNQSKPFTDIGSAVITRSTAVKLFGSDDAMGKELLVHGMTPVIITGVIEDYPLNSSITAGLLVNAENESFKFSRWIGDARDLSTYWWPFQIYLQLKKNSDPARLINYINKEISILHPYAEHAGLLKLRDVYLHDTTSGSETKKGNPNLLKILIWIALIILSLAIINYINLTVAQQHRKNKETGIRKVMGASVSDILANYLSESLLVSFISLAVGYYLVEIMIPFYNSVFGTTLNFSLFSKLPYIMIVAGIVSLIGLISGIVPAILLSGITPIRALYGTIVSPRKKRYFNKILTIFQFTVSVILIFCVIIITRQIKFLKHRDPGFSEELLLRVDLPYIQGNDMQKAKSFLSECRKSPFIKEVSISSGVPGQIYQHMGSNMENSRKNISIPCILADSAFLRTFGLNVVKGRDPEPGDYGKVCMLNEAAYRHFEFDNLDNKRFNNYRSGGFEIIGIVKDFQFTSLHKTIGPVCIMITPDFLPTSVNIRFNINGVAEGMKELTSLWQEILTAYPLKYQFYDEWFDSMYKSEERIAKSISLFAILSIVISCIGMLGLAIFSTERRTKEIGIRKVNGAGITEVMILLNREFAIWVVSAFIIGIPVMQYSMHLWLSSFAYRTTLDWWLFAFSGSLAFGIALTTVSLQSWKVATRNPVEALRYE
jgi:putative ABC transport system permease protein